MAFLWKRKIGILCGGTNEICYSVVGTCIEYGMNVMIVELERYKECVVNMLGQWVHNVELYFIKDFDDMHGLRNDIKDRIKCVFGRDSIDIVINNMECNDNDLYKYDMINSDVECIENILNENFWNGLYLTQILHPLLENGGGDDMKYLVNTCSLSSLMTSKTFYGVSKQMVFGLTELLKHEIHLRKNNNILVIAFIVEYRNNDNEGHNLMDNYGDIKHLLKRNKYDYGKILFSNLSTISKNGNNKKSFIINVNPSLSISIFGDKLKSYMKPFKPNIYQFTNKAINGMKSKL